MCFFGKGEYLLIINATCIATSKPVKQEFRNKSGSRRLHSLLWNDNWIPFLTSLPSDAGAQIFQKIFLWFIYSSEIILALHTKIWKQIPKKLFFFTDNNTNIFSGNFVFTFSWVTVLDQIYYGGQVGAHNKRIAPKNKRK